MDMPRVKAVPQKRLDHNNRSFVATSADRTSLLQQAACHDSNPDPAVDDEFEGMFVEDHDELFYLMMYNEALPMPARPDHVDLDDGVVRGGYLLEPAAGDGPRVNLLGSGTILFEVMQAANTLRDEGYAVAVYSITSYVELARDAERAEQEDAVDTAWLDTIFPETDVPTVAATDYVRALPRMIASWINGPFTALGTDGFGKSERRSDLRAHFKVDAASIADAARRLASR